MVSWADDNAITLLCMGRDCKYIKTWWVWSAARYFFSVVTLICHISHPWAWFFKLSTSITCCARLEAPSESLTCNQRSVCLCQGSTVNCQLTKEWKNCVLGLACALCSQQESFGVSSSWDIMDSPRQWNTIPPGESARRPPETLSHNTPSPVWAKPNPWTADMGQMEGWWKGVWREGECEITLSRSRW